MKVVKCYLYRCPQWQEDVLQAIVKTFLQRDIKIGPLFSHNYFFVLAFVNANRLKSNMNLGRMSVFDLHLVYLSC